jgi:hypothetical protein
MLRELPTAGLARGVRSAFRILAMPLPPAFKRTLIALCLLAAALLWSNSRILALRLNQDPARPVVLSGYHAYHGMAAALEEGRLGQLDLTRYRDYLAFGNPSATYTRASDHAPRQFVDYYSLDIGYSFIVEASRLAFPTLPDNHLRSLALQLLTDLGMLSLVYALFAPWDKALGALAVLLYAGNKVFCWLVSFAYYYYWDVPFTFAVFGLVLLCHRRATQSTLYLGIAGFVLGFGAWVRASWWPIAFLLLGLALLAPALRRRAIVGLAVFAAVTGPQVYRSSRARGQLALSTRATWHVALVGLGYYPNPYGLEAKDEPVFRLTREKYGIAFRMEDYGEHDRAARQEFLSILRRDPQFVLRSFLGRLRESLLGTTATSLAPYPYLSNPLYRLLCLNGLALMVVAGGERRWLGLAAGGTYLVYVLITSLFYFVGLAYDNVSQVALFVLFLGGLDGARRAAHRLIQAWVTSSQDTPRSSPVAVSE